MKRNGANASQVLTQRPNGGLRNEQSNVFPSVCSKYHETLLKYQLAFQLAYVLPPSRPNWAQLGVSMLVVDFQPSGPLDP